MGIQVKTWRFFYTTLFLVCGVFVKALAVSDTVLTKVYSQYHFLNVAAHPDGQILCGTTAGVLAIDGEDLTFVSEDAGYLTIDTIQKSFFVSQEPVQGASPYFWKHLLSPALSKGLVTHAFAENYCYLVAQGKLYVFRLTAYKWSFQNLDVLAVDPNGVGGNFGVYLNNSFVTGLPTTPTAIHVFDSVTFLCYQGFWALTKKDTLKFDAQNRDNFLFQNQTYGSITELAPLLDHQYLMFCDSGVFQINFQEQTIAQLAAAVPSEVPPQLLGTIEDTRYISIGSELYRFLPQTGLFELLFDAHEVILSGTVAHFNVYVLTASQIFKHDLTTTTALAKNGNKAHSMLFSSDQTILMGSSHGLFAYDIDKNEQQELLLDIQCNRAALAVNAHAIFIGTPEGLLTIPKMELPHLMAEMQRKKEPSLLKSHAHLVFTIFFLMITIAGIFFYLKYLKLKNQLSQQSQQCTDLRLEEIEKFIYENLPRVNLPMLCSHFNTSLNSIYKVMSPDRPGALIHRARMLVMMELEKQGADTEEISLKTGFSFHYVQKIRRKIPIAS